MLLIEVDQHQASSVELRKGEKNGRPWEIRSQPVWVFVDGAKYPIEINLNLPDGVANYSVGKYEMNLDCAVTQGNFNRLNIDERKIKLLPVKVG